MSFAVALRLGRVSNLPTVWTDVLAALALAGAPLFQPLTLGLIGALSCFYVAGMYLNDAFDAGIDAAQRPDRPIPAGLVSRTAVFAAGFAGLAAGTAALAGLAHLAGRPPGPAALAGLALAGAIVLYDVWHKGNPIGPVLMGLNRLLVYAAAAVAATGTLAWAPLAGGALLLAYVIGLTYAAKQEHLARIGSLWPLGVLALPVVAGLALAPASPWAYAVLAAFLAWTVYAVRLLLRRPPQVGRAVVSLIAGIALFDAAVLAHAGELAAAGLAALGFGLTLALQRWVAGT